MEEEFKIPKTVLQEHAAREKNGVEIKQRGRKGVFTSDEELELKNYFVMWHDLGLHLLLVTLGKLLQTM